MPTAAIIAVLLVALLNHAKKFLDNDKDYDDKVSFVISTNREVVRQRLRYLADDLTNDQSDYALQTLDNEAFVESRTAQLLICFRRMKWCRAGMKGAYFGCELAKWTAYVGFALVLGFIVANITSSAGMVKVDEILLGACVSLCVIGMVLAELCFQSIRRQHKKSQGIDASIPS